MGGLKFSKPRQLAPTDDISDFNCGLQKVDDWFHAHAQSAKKRGTAVVYVTFCEGKVAGFYTLNAKSITRATVSNRWLKANTPHEIPVILFGMLGVDDRFKGRGLGRQLLLDAVHQAQRIANELGAKALLVESATDDAITFYKKCGFEPIKDMSHMFAKL
jgi:GNAT superfamily N-acetyltransferase